MSAAILCLSLLALRAGDDNPFEAAAQDAYTGRFRSAEVELRLMPESGQWHGSLIFKGKTYTAAGAVKSGRLEGTFADGDQSWPFAALTEGNQLTFTAGKFTNALVRQKLPKLEGTWGSSKVEIEFQSTNDLRTGLIRFNGNEFSFVATEKAGDLEGTFKNGDKSYPFSVANEPRGLIFETGTFTDQIKRFWKNSLGMKFVPVPGTRVQFGVWDVRVQDFEAFVNASGYDATSGMYSLKSDGWKQRGDTWKSPGFTQGPTYPVVGVTWQDTKAFCAWLTKKERSEGKISETQSYRLPTDAEWSVAVGLNEYSGSTPAEKSKKIPGAYPWGTTWPPPNGAGNYAGSEAKNGDWPDKFGIIEGYSDGYARTSPVGSFAANQFGLYDMGGNVWQWCEDWYDGEQKSRVLRGASWCGPDPVGLLSSFRGYGTPEDRLDYSGFRCVLEDSSSP